MIHDRAHAAGHFDIVDGRGLLLALRLRQGTLLDQGLDELFSKEGIALSPVGGKGHELI